MASNDETTREPTMQVLEAWELPPEEIDRLLATSDDHRLRILFGADYDELRDLARKARGVVRGQGPKVLVVPGILGSTIGKSGNFFTRDTIWFDPASIVQGKIVELKLPPSGKSSLQSLDVVSVVHAYLRLRLKMQGFSVEYYHYDWRQSIATLGKQLANHIKQLKSKVMIVAHSMGGLVTRAALHFGAPDITRVVMLGTPNRGSFSPVEVLQGINSNVILVDKLDAFHDAAQLTKEVFSTFPSVYEMLPRPEVFADIDLFDRSNWPTKPLQPTARRLSDAQDTWKHLVQDDDRLFLIAGYQQETVTNLSINTNGNFQYHTSMNGDGTVPLQMCLLPGVPTVYARETHTGLLRSEAVAMAVSDLLRGGRTSRLEAERSPVRDGWSQTLQRSDFTEDERGSDLLGNQRGSAIDPMDLPLIVEAAISFSSMPARQTMDTIRQRQSATITKPGYCLSGTTSVSGSSGRLTTGITFKQTVISRDLQSHLDLELYYGSLFDAPFRAVVIGIFTNVDPKGPAAVLDKLTNGAVTELMNRRMFDAGVGKVFVMPTGRNALRADYVVLAGLGEYSEFSMNAESAMRTVSCNILRTLMNCGVDEFATVMYGGASGLSMRDCAESFVRGYLDALTALADNKDSIQFRRVALCENQEDRYAELKDEAYRLGGTELCTNIRLRLHEVHYPATASMTMPASDSRVMRQDDRRPERIVYLTIRVEVDSEDSDRWSVFASLLGAGSKATVFPSAKEISRIQLDKLLGQLPSGDLEATLDVGDKLRKLLLTEDFIEVLNHDLTMEDHLAVIIDDQASRIPWETLPLLKPGKTVEGSQLPCLAAGLSRRYQTDGSNSLAKFLEERKHTPILNVLLIINPTDDLPGAELEGDRLTKILTGLNMVRVETRSNEQATRLEILQEIDSGKYDVVHYAGHAFFDPDDRSRSGLICADKDQSGRNSVLTGRDVAKLNRLPSLMFFNACESGRIRGQGDVNSNTSARKKISDPGDIASGNAGVAEALLRGGIAQFVGTYWPVGDSAAEAFATSFYKDIADGKTVREAVLSGRAAVKESDSPDLANYMHYGDPAFVIKERTGD